LLKHAHNRLLNETFVVICINQDTYQWVGHTRVVSSLVLTLLLPGPFPIRSMSTIRQTDLMTLSRYLRQFRVWMTPATRGSPTQNRPDAIQVRWLMLPKSKTVSTMAPPAVQL